MPPKAKAGLRRPAAAGGVRRRPAARVAAGVPAAREDKQLRLLDLDGLRGLERILLKQADYFGRKVDLCGIACGVRVAGREVFLDFKATGVQDDLLLRALTGKADRMMEVHVCQADCSRTLEGELMVHGDVFKEVTRDEEPWFSNVEAVIPSGHHEGEVDELARLREEARGVEGPPRGPEKRKKEKKDKKTPKEERAAKAAKEDKESGRESEGDEPDRKPLDLMFGGTGLDPDSKRRRKIMKKARKVGQGKKRKKKKKSGSSGSKSSRSSSSRSSGDEEPGAALFTSDKKVKVVWRRYPGALTAASLAEAKERLLTASGSLWDKDRRSLPPLFVYYSRQHIMGGMSPPMAQETLTISLALDLIIQGRAASAADVLSQRIKALECLSRGSHWTMARQLELCRTDQTGIAEEGEALAAAKGARDEERLKNYVARPYHPKGPESGGAYPYKGKKGKEGKGSQKGNAEDQQKGKGGEGRKDDAGGWQKKK